MIIGLAHKLRQGRVATLADMENWWVNALWSITPTVLIGALFAIVLRFILRADRNERRVYREMEERERARLGLPPRDEA